MITCAEALRLPSARLTDEEARAADAMEAQIDAFIRQHMSRNGVTFQTRETRMPVITEMQWRIRRAGWALSTIGLEQQSSLYRHRKDIVGYGFVITPSDEAQKAAEIIASG